MTIAIIVGAYLIGSISFGYLISRILLGQDVRTLGSGNPGATNVLRILGIKAGVLVLILDVLKGFAVIMFCRLIGASDIVIALSGLAVVAGHNWPIFFSFRGGKGAATTLGVFFAIDPLLTFVAFLVIMLIVAVTQYMSVGSIAGAISIPFVLYARGHSKVLVVFGALFTLLIIWRHLPNIKRLLQGTENKISKNAYKR